MFSFISFMCISQFLKKICQAFYPDYVRKPETRDLDNLYLHVLSQKWRGATVFQTLILYLESICLLEICPDNFGEIILNFLKFFI